MGLKPRKKSSDPKTKPSSVSPEAFIASLEEERRRGESEQLLAMMTELTGEKAVIWGGNIVGFGNYHYTYASGREGDWPRIGFSPRKASLTVYCMPGFKGQQDLLARLGPHKTSVSCLYIRRLENVDMGVLRAITARALSEMKSLYP